jgi:hypothetical protein
MMAREMKSPTDEAGCMTASDPLFHGAQRSGWGTKENELLVDVLQLVMYAG